MAQERKKVVTTDTWSGRQHTDMATVVRRNAVVLEKIEAWAHRSSPSPTSPKSEKKK